MLLSDQLKQERAEHLDAMRALDKAATGRQLTEAEKRQWEASSAEVTRLNGEIEFEEGRENLRHIDQQAAALARDAKRGIKPRPRPQATPWATAARALFSGKTTKVNNDNLPEFMEHEHRVLLSAGAAGVYLDDPVISADELIFTSLAQSYIEQLGVDIFDLKPNNNTLPKITGGYSGLAAYTEAENIPVGDPTIEAVKFEAKNFGLLVKVHNNVLRDAGERTAAILNGFFTRAINDLLLKKILAGDSADDEFDGLDNVSGINTVNAAGATITHAHMLQAVRKCLLGNADLALMGALMGPFTWEDWNLLLDQQDQPLMLPDGLKGLKYLTSTAVAAPGGTINQTAYVGDWSTVKLGLLGRYDMLLDQRFADADQTAFAVVIRADMAVFEPEKMCLIQNLETT